MIRDPHRPCPPMPESDRLPRRLAAPRIPLAALAFAALLGMPNARAADKPKPAAGKPAAPLLTRDELRTCMAQQGRIRTERDEVNRLRGAIETEKAELVRSGEALKAQLEALDRSSQEAVDRYNEAASSRDRAIDAFEARTTEFNRRAEALQGEMDGYAKACENRRFDEKDEIAIKNGK